MALNRIPQAIRRFELLHAARPDHFETAFRLIGLYLLANNATQSMQTLKSSPPAIRDSAPFLAATAVVLQDFDHHAEAAEIFRDAERIAKSPGHEQDVVLSVQFYYRYGSACDRIGDYARAMAAFERCLEMDPNCHEALNNIAYMWAEHGTNLVQAADYVRRALQFEARNPAYVDTLGWIYYNQKNFHAALEQLLTAQQIMPDDPSITDHLGDAYEALQDHELALVYWQESLRLDPDNKAVAAKVKASKRAAQAGPGATPVQTGK